MGAACPGAILRQIVTELDRRRIGDVVLVLHSVGFVNGAILLILFRMKPHGLRPSPRMIERELCNDLDSADAEEVVAPRPCASA